MRAFGYCRVSTEQQADEGVSLEAQQAKIAAWCLANDIELDTVFVDAGISGKRADNRPELQKALIAACKAKGVLVVYSLSRLARSTRDTLMIAERLDKAGADMVSLSEKIDTTSASGKMMFRMLAVLAEFERDQISERTTSAMRHKQSKQERVGEVPYGYDLSADGVTLSPNAEEQEAIGLINTLHQAGMSLRAIAAELNGRSVPSKKGGEWIHTAISRILKRRSVAA